MDTQVVGSRRKILNHAVCSILMECGFESCEKAALETLTELLQSRQYNYFRFTYYLKILLDSSIKYKYLIFSFA